MSEGLGDPVEGRTYRSIIVAAAIAFIVLPLITTFNELLTALVERLRLVALIQRLAAPFLVKVVALILRALGVPAAGSGSYLYLTGGWMPLRIYLSWNCIGWQSLILLVFTFATGLQGPYTRRSKLLTVLIGVEGTFLVNVLRLLVPCLLGYYFGYVPAIVFHDYLGTVLTLSWLSILWYLSFGSLLVRAGPPRGGIRSSSMERPDDIGGADRGTVDDNRETG